MPGGTVWSASTRHLDTSPLIAFYCYILFTIAMGIFRIALYKRIARRIRKSCPRAVQDEESGPPKEDDEYNEKTPLLAYQSHQNHCYRSSTEAPCCYDANETLYVQSTRYDTCTNTSGTLYVPGTSYGTPVAQYLVDRPEYQYTSTTQPISRRHSIPSATPRVLKYIDRVQELKDGGRGAVEWDKMQSEKTRLGRL